MKAHQIKFLVNGEQSSSIHINDRGLQFGDGDLFHLKSQIALLYQNHLVSTNFRNRKMRIHAVPGER